MKCKYCDRSKEHHSIKGQCFVGKTTYEGSSLHRALTETFFEPAEPEVEKVTKAQVFAERDAFQPEGWPPAPVAKVAKLVADSGPRVDTHNLSNLPPEQMTAHSGTVNYVQEVRSDDTEGPSCHVCGAIMVKAEAGWKCKSCGATTQATEAQICCGHCSAQPCDRCPVHGDGGLHQCEAAAQRADQPAVEPQKCTCITTGSGACKYPHACRQCDKYHPGVSCYWYAHGKTSADKRNDGRTFPLSDGRLGCNECCNGDRCDDRSHHSRDNCPYCLGSNLIPQPEAGSKRPEIPPVNEVNSLSQQKREHLMQGEAMNSFSPSDITPKTRCMKKGSKYHCSLTAHNGKHIAYLKHVIGGEILEEWPVKTRAEASVQQEPLNNETKKRDAIAWMEYAERWLLNPTKPNISNAAICIKQAIVTLKSQPAAGRRE